MTKSLMKHHATQVVPPWIQKMRAAVAEGVTEADIKEIVASQVKKAKEGDQKAIKFVFDQLLGGLDLKGATFIQNIYQGGDEDV